MWKIEFSTSKQTVPDIVGDAKNKIRENINGSGQIGPLTAGPWCPVAQRPTVRPKKVDRKFFDS